MKTTRTMTQAKASRPAAFTILELLISMAVLSVLMAALVPVVTLAREAADDLKCKNNLRVIGTGISSYSAAYRGLYPPLCWWRDRPMRYWWGTSENPPNFEKGLLADFIGREAGQMEGLFECPQQPWGTYEPQAQAPGPTTTYGYNGYYLSPIATPGWANSIRTRGWRSQTSIPNPGQVFVLADTLMVWGNGAGIVSNNCLLDPPWTFIGKGRWTKNPQTTVCFRHGGRANVFFADGRVDSVLPTVILDQEHHIGYVGESNAPHYVPDYDKW